MKLLVLKKTSIAFKLNKFLLLYNFMKHDKFGTFNLIKIKMFLIK